jgi:DNA polymerase-3 subunit epsilon
MPYAIIDIETTGLSAKSEKITEIAIILHDGKKETGRFQTLINPERRIPYRITRLTGINDMMVAAAPRFYEIAKKIIELTEGKTIVAHNVTFDYNFLRAEFAEFGYDFHKPVLCTVKLSRKTFPGMPSYSLAKLTSQLGIEHSRKHRAEGDAEATKKLFELILQTNPGAVKDKNPKLPKALDNDKINSLPDLPGVYYFLDSQGNVIYVGKSKNIRQRIRQHLNNHTTKKSVEMMNNISDIKTTVTGSELIALLLESEEIKRLRPLYNRAQLRSYFGYGLFMSTNNDGYLTLAVKKVEALSTPLTSFSSSREGKEFLHFLSEEYRLCHRYCGLHNSNGACFAFQLHKCDGACTGKEPAETYNKKVMKAVKRLQFRHKSFFLLEKGRNEDEYGVIQVKNGNYRGYGYIPENEINNRNIPESRITPVQPNRDFNNIILSWLRNNKYEMIINNQ